MRILKALATAATARVAALVTALAAVSLSLAAAPASAATHGGVGGGERTGRSCGALRLAGSLPAPPAGMAVQQEVSIGADCAPRLGAVRLVPLDRSAAAGRARTATGPASATVNGAAAGDARKAAGAGTAGAGTAGAGTAGAGTAGAGTAVSGPHRIAGWNEMYDCCNIRMTGLYTTSEWTTEDGRVVSAATGATQRWNREPWDAGWSLKSAGRDTDCAADCPVSRTEAHADFTYRGVFDVTGVRYANTHHSSVELGADGRATCRFDVELRHTFIGWNWRRGCA
ncbi:hypothetical protein ACF1A5_23820 [Streptomyces sp. NPDC014864]|uniref:hypothetical protein n=1 Tax=Streptomyces sp. NPDC014864 TaxID=3364924 RepID=UPI003701B4A0